jgi:hypothetical protein
MLIRIFLLILSISLWWISAAEAATRNAATCNTADVQAAHTASANGDTIQCPSGSFTWSGLNITKAITIQGRGAGATTIALAANNNTVTKSASGVITFDGFTLTGPGGSNANKGFSVGGSWKNARPVIFKNSTMNGTGGGMFLLTVAGGVMFFNNTWVSGWDDSMIAIKDPNDTSGSWTSIDTMGVNDTATRFSGTIAGTTGELNHYVEGNTFTGGSNQGIDCDDACRMVFRHNISTNFQFNSHGFGTSAVGNRHWEIYSNDMRNTCSRGTDCSNNSNQQHMFLLRAGTGVIYNNVTDNLKTSSWGDKTEAGLFIDSNHDASATNCVGVGSYPLNHQIGWGYNGSAQVLDPIYLWNNSVNNNGSSPLTFDLSTGWFYACAPVPNTYLLAGREYINNSGNTTAKPGYTAFTYPHPLLTGGGGDTVPPVAPSNLRVN